MFTGIVTAIGTIANVQQRGDLRLRIAAPLDPARIDIGASIACSGVCLTVVERGGTAGDAWFEVDVSGETVSRTVPGMWEQGRQLNLVNLSDAGWEMNLGPWSGHYRHRPCRFGAGLLLLARQEGRQLACSAIRARGRNVGPSCAEKG